MASSPARPKYTSSQMPYHVMLLRVSSTMEALTVPMAVREGAGTVGLEMRNRRFEGEREAKAI